MNNFIIKIAIKVAPWKYSDVWRNYRKMRLIFIYAVLAVVATIFNIAAQDVIARAYDGPFHLALSVIAGTGTGLLVKYGLDKRYIFQYKAINLRHDSGTFALYSIMGLATTAIFWAFEFSFAYLFATKGMQYAGGMIGLTIGYVVKYQLDSRFVFGR